MFLLEDSKRVEALLELEMRHVAGLEGTLVPYTGSKSFWTVYDFLIFFGLHSREKIVRLSISNSERTGMSFEDSLEAVVRNANGHAKRLLGTDALSIERGPSN